MSKILILGAGRSATVLIDYLLEEAKQNNHTVIVADMSEKIALDKIGNHPNGKAMELDATNEQSLEKAIENSDIVVSLLPATLHYLAAKQCVKHKIDMVTASYVSPEIQDLHEEAKKAGIILLQEMGVDPGIDHMSAMKLIDEIKKEVGEIKSFKSFTGGLVAPEYDTNPWGYKFTWNPMNVVLAGKGGAKFIRNGWDKYIPYHNIFKRIETHSVLNYGEFEAYPNRDSLSYRTAYGLENIPTIFRGTFRKAGFCAAWNMLVQLGLTENAFEIEVSDGMTYRDFTNTFLVYNITDSVEKKVADVLGLEMDSPEMKKLNWLGIFDRTPITIKKGTPAQILLELLQSKWSLEDGDKDMIVMQHLLNYELNGKFYELKSSMICIGDDQLRTSMAKTVGLPAAIGAKLVLNKKIKAKGVVIPTTKEIYEPILDELKSFGIDFIEEKLESDIV